MVGYLGPSSAEGKWPISESLSNDEFHVFHHFFTPKSSAEEGILGFGTPPLARTSGLHWHHFASDQQLGRMSRWGMIMPSARQVKWLAQCQVQEGEKARIGKQSSASMPSPVLTLPSYLLLCHVSWQGNGSEHPDLKPGKICRRLCSHILDKTASCSSLFSDVFCNVILIFAALGQTSRLWFSVWSSASVVHF